MPNVQLTRTASTPGSRPSEGVHSWDSPLKSEHRRFETLSDTFHTIKVINFDEVEIWSNEMKFQWSGGHILWMPWIPWKSIMCFECSPLLPSADSNWQLAASSEPAPRYCACRTYTSVICDSGIMLQTVNNNLELMLQYSCVLTSTVCHFRYIRWQQKECIYWELPILLASSLEGGLLRIERYLTSIYSMHTYCTSVTHNLHHSVKHSYAFPYTSVVLVMSPKPEYHTQKLLCERIPKLNLPLWKTADSYS